MIEISCPQCNTDLEIDEGFAGGICRCFSCGALMTVPDNPELQAAEYLTRPDRPDRPEAPGAGGGQSYEPTPGPQTFVTKTGREVKVTEQQLRAIPTARKRRVGVRATVITIFILVVLGIGASIAFLIVQFFKAQEPEDPTKVVERVFVVSSNPFLPADSSPSMLTVDSPRSPVAVVVDGSRSMEGSMYQVLELYMVGLASLPDDARAQLIVASDGKLTMIPSSSERISAMDQAAARRQIDEMRARGSALLHDGVASAATSGAKTIIVVSQNKPDLDDMARMRQSAVTAGAALYFVHLQLVPKASDSELDAMTDPTGGKRIPLEIGNLELWYNQWLDRQ